MMMNSLNLPINDGVSEEIELPSETAYASIIVNQVNDKVLRKAQTARIGKGHLVAFGVLVLMLSVGLSVCSLIAFSNIFGGLFKETFAEKMLSSGWIFILPTLISAVCILSACCALYSRNSKR